MPRGEAADRRPPATRASPNLPRDAQDQRPVGYSPQLLFDIVARATGANTSEKVTRAKKGVVARKDALTPEQRSGIAKKAAAARWGKIQPGHA